MKFEARAPQLPIIRHIFEHPRCAIWANMGIGKTSACLIALRRLAWTHPVFPALVVAPKRVAETTWPDEVRKFDVLRDLRVATIIGDNPAQRMRAFDTPADLYTTNYENLPWLVEMFGTKWPFKTIIADEATKLKGFRVKQGAKRPKALMQVAMLPSVQRFIELTGTPSPNGLIDLHGQVYFLDFGQRLGRTYSAYQDRWFQRSRNGVSYKTLPHAQGEIEERLNDICISVKAEDYYPVDEPIQHSIKVDLPKEARRLYDEMAKEMFMQIEKDLSVEVFNAAARTMKCLQLANGAFYYPDPSDPDKERMLWREVHDAKIQALESVIEEAAGMPVLVAYYFKTDLARLLKAFPKARKLDDNPQTIKDWNNGDIPVLLAHPASAGHGLNLQDGSNIICHFAHNWNLEEYMQINERIGPLRQKQSGYNRPVFEYHIVARNTVEEQVMERIKSKRSVQDLLLEAMKASK